MHAQSVPQLCTHPFTSVVQSLSFASACACVWQLPMFGLHAHGVLAAFTVQA
jgi:hypothetical protein